jgi:hypothetical protein
MTHISPVIVQHARDFWKSAGGEYVFPCDIAWAVNFYLPVNVVWLPELRLNSIQSWLKDNKVRFDLQIDDRPLHGFILVLRGKGLIFVNESDTEQERRYTIAHEASHYLLDYKVPKDKAVKKLGESILEVFDGLREPTREELIDGALVSVTIKPFTHLLEKKQDGYRNPRISDAENYADQLALELLAPSTDVVKEVNPDKTKISFDDFKDKCHQILRNRYLIPDPYAETYALRLTIAVTGGRSLASKLGF